MAENSGAPSVQFHPDLMEQANDPLIRQQMQTQIQLFESRRDALRADLQSLDESIQGQQGMMTAWESIAVNRKNQLALLTDELDNTRALVKEGYAPRNRQLELERAVAEANTSMSDLQGNLVRGKHAIAELGQRKLTKQKEYRKEVESMLGDVTREVQADEPKFRAVYEDLGRTEIRATVNGQVMGLMTQTPGSVVGPGQKLMDIVPDNESLVLEAKVAPNLIDRVHTGLAVSIRFTAFAHSPQLVVDGKVISVSNDLIVEPQSNVAYYLARATVTPEGLKALGQRQMQPGMPAEVVFKTGERTLLTYLMHPLTKRIAAAMKEE